jgi:hypothetical protein
LPYVRSQTSISGHGTGRSQAKKHIRLDASRSGALVSLRHSCVRPVPTHSRDDPEAELSLLLCTRFDDRQKLRVGEINKQSPSPIIAGKSGFGIDGSTRCLSGASKAPQAEMAIKLA